MKQISSLTLIVSLVLGASAPANAELFPASGPPGTTVTVGGDDFGECVSTAVNRVEFNGASALIQLWEKILLW